MGCSSSKPSKTQAKAEAKAQGQGQAHSQGQSQGQTQSQPQAQQVALAKPAESNSSPVQAKAEAKAVGETTSANPEEGHRITESMLVKAVANELKVSAADVTIKSFEVSGGSAKGDNYACTMKALDVVALIKGEERKLQYIAKCIPMNEFRANMMTKSGMFTSEVVVYDKILPQLKNLEKCCCTNPNFPKHFYASGDEGVIIMENMKLKGWYMAEKLTGLNTIQMRLLLQQLARLHATSYHYLNTFPGGYDAFKKDFEIFTRDTWFVEGAPGNEAVDQAAEQMFSGAYLSFVSIVKELWTGDMSVIDKLMAFNGVRKGRLNAMHKPVEEGKGINCILHADSWCNNFLFKNNADGVLSEATILDLQVMKRGRPGVDLAYLFGTSTTPEFRKEHLEEMLRFYHAELSRVLLLHGYDSETLLPFSMFRKEFDECYVIGFIMGSMSLQMQLFIPDPDTFFSDKEPDKADVEKMERQKLEMVRSNSVLSNRFLAVAKEAIAYGILSGV